MSLEKKGKKKKRKEEKTLNTPNFKSRLLFQNLEKYGEEYLQSRKTPYEENVALQELYLNHLS